MTDAIGAALDQDKSIDGIMALGPPAYSGTVSALQAKQLLGKMKLASFDTSTDILNGVQNGQVPFTIDQQPYLQGYYAVQVLSQQARSGIHPFRQVFTGPAVVDKSNVVGVAAAANASPSYSKQLSISMVTHGSPVDTFWSTVREGAEQAAKDFNVKLDYKAPDLSGKPSQSTLIDDAVG
jgi:ABC-type sugar transport system substrate-binding protein